MLKTASLQRKLDFKGGTFIFPNIQISVQTTIESLFKITWVRRSVHGKDPHMQRRDRQTERERDRERRRERERDLMNARIQISSVQFSPLTDWVVGGTWGTIQQRSSSSLSWRKYLWAALAWSGMSTLWCGPSSTSSADHGVVHPPRCPDGEFWRGCRVLRVTWPNHASFRLLSVASRGFCGPSRKLVLLRTQSMVLCSK